MSGGNDKCGGLAELQAEFIASLSLRRQDLPGGIVGHVSASPSGRFAVHRNRAVAGLVDTLRARYPAVMRLAGEEFFRAAARLYAAEDPPRSPALLDYGGGFPGFLARFEPAQGLPYLAGVARLEWLRHRAYHAADAVPMPASALAEAPRERIGDAVLRLHPSAAILASDYPILSIWETNVMDETVRPIGPDLAGEAVLIVRPMLEVLVMRLGPGGFEFIEEIASGGKLASAARCAEAASPDFDLAGGLGALLAVGAFTGFTLGEVET
ncbi:MAG: DUF2063 domain-containing protein [Rhodomicrobium sp.]|nr:DUF2063 domain-containing protein [Rhodomicrobium sp.]